MLVLSRRKNEAIAIGPNVRVMVCGVKGEMVKLGIEAPGLSIMREELTNGSHARPADRRVRDGLGAGCACGIGAP